ncbi:MAG: cytidine deaminase [Nitrospira sp.]
MKLRKKGATEDLSQSKDPELFIGLVGAVGTDLNFLCTSLKESLAHVNYRFEEIHIIEQIHLFKKWQSLPEKPLEGRYKAHIAAGDDFRETFGLGDALARWALATVKAIRQQRTGDSDEPVSRMAFGLRSLKHPEEIALLRKVYGPNFFLIAAYSPYDMRLDQFMRKIAGSHHVRGSAVTKYRSAAAEILELDQVEGEKRLGQNLRESFPQADVFINVADKDSTRQSVKRFIDLLFNNSQEFHTPSQDEQGMFLAKASALRSAALGRQVGAAITNYDGSVLSLGTNEVPKFGGGMCWPGSVDHRDFRQGEDISDQMKKAQFAEILGSLRKHGWFKEGLSEKEEGDLVKEALPLVKGSRLMSLIEFGRNVHAEMAALLDAAARGVSVRDSTMYTTTFPCHDCARHIVAAGIKRVAYVEPYPKSLALDFHNDSIEVDPHSQVHNKVVFHQFVGIAPSRYIDLFTATERKGVDGKLLPWDNTRAVPRHAQSVVSYLQREKDAVALLERLRKAKCLDLV